MLSNCIYGKCFIWGCFQPVGWFQQCLSEYAQLILGQELRQIHKIKIMHLAYVVKANCMGNPQHCEVGYTVIKEALI